MIRSSWLPLLALVALLSPLLVSAAGPYGQPSVVSVTASPNSQNRIVFTINLDRTLVPGSPAYEYLTIDLGGAGTAAGITNPVGPYSCLDNNGAGTNDWATAGYAGSSGSAVYAIYNLILATGTGSDWWARGCNFPMQLPAPAVDGNTYFKGFILINFHSGTIVAPIFFGAVTLTQTPSTTSSPAVLNVLLTSVAGWDTVITPQVLTGSLYRASAPPVAPASPAVPYPIAPLSAPLNSHFVLTFQSTSDIPFAYWLTDLKLYICPTGVSLYNDPQCVQLQTNKYTPGPPPANFATAPSIPLTTTVGTGGTHFGYQNPAAAELLTFNNVISFWIGVPASLPNCPSPSSCNIRAVVTLSVIQASVHNQAAPVHMELQAAAGRENSDAPVAMRKMAVTDANDLTFLADAEFTYTPAESAAASYLAASTPMAIMLVLAVLALLSARA